MIHSQKAALLAAIFSFVLFSCSKQLTPSNSNGLSKTSDAVTPDLLPGPCPYPCTDTRCKAYLNGYCGGTSDTSIDMSNQADSNATTQGILTGAYNELSTSVNFSELSTEMGVTVTASAIDFSGGLLAYDINNQSPFNKVLGANFYQNTRNPDTLYCFAWLATTSSLTTGQPFMIKFVVGQYFTLYDLDFGYEYTVTNYNTSSYKISEKQGAYISGGGGEVAMGRITPLVAGCNGQNVINCITDAYGNHGWASAWLFVQTAFLPVTALAMAGACAAINCISHQD
jgi:hypothetical protein